MVYCHYSSQVIQERNPRNPTFEPGLSVAYPQIKNRVPIQHAKKVMSDSPGLADFAIGLVNPVLNRSIFGGNSNYRRTVMCDSRKYPYHTTK